MASSSSSSSLIKDLLVPTYKQMLQHVAKWLDKATESATAEKPTGNEDAKTASPVTETTAEQLLSRRLAPDMFPLDTQIRFICFQSHEVIFRLQHKEIPPEVLEIANEGRTNANSTEQITMDQAKVRIEEALKFLDKVIQEYQEDSEENKHQDEKISFELPGGIVFENMSPAQYVRDWAIPQFYFHVVVAYSILRNAGVNLGKADYVPHMFQYLRPPTGNNTPDNSQQQEEQQPN